MKLTKTIKIKDKEKDIELIIKHSGNAKWDSIQFKKDFDYFIDALMIALLKEGYHYSDIESR
jgi:hypothetical protein